MWDQDERSADDPMGQVKIPFASLEVGRSYAQWWPITTSDGAYDATGALFLKVYVGPRTIASITSTNDDALKDTTSSSPPLHEKVATTGFDPARILGGSRESSARSSGSREGSLMSPMGLMSSVTRRRRSKGLGNDANSSYTVTQQRPASKSVAIPPVEVFVEKGQGGEGGRAMVKLGKFLAVRADYAFHADDRYGVNENDSVVLDHEERNKFLKNVETLQSVLLRPVAPRDAKKKKKSEVRLNFPFMTGWKCTFLWRGVIAFVFALFLTLFLLPRLGVPNDDEAQRLLQEQRWRIISRRHAP